MNKKKDKIKTKLKELIIKIQRSPIAQTVNKYNIYAMGIKNYYRYATHINIDFSKIAYQISKTLYNRLKSVGKYEIPIKPNENYRSFNKNNFRTYKVAGLYLHLIADIQTKNNMNFSQDICNYTEHGRDMIYKKLKPEITTEINKLMKNIYNYNSVELADNKLSNYSAQKGKCLITGDFLYADEVEIHHKKPKSLGGTDEFANLIVVHKDIHKLIHATTSKTIERYMQKLNLNVKQIEKVSKYRKECNLISLA